MKSMLSRPAAPRPAVRLARLAAAIAAAAAGFAVLPASAQTSGTWDTTTPAIWSNPSNWIGGVPDGGGVATFGLQPRLAAPVAVGLDIPVSLSGIVFDSPLQYQIVNVTFGDGSQANQAITLTGPANVLVSQSPRSTPAVLQVGHIINRPLAGTAGLNVSGGGTLTIGANTYTGATTVTGTTLRTTGGDASFGTGTDALSLDNATLRVATTALATGRTITLTGQNTLDPFSATTLNGSVTGTGGLTVGVGGQNVTLGGTNTFTGPLVLRGPTGLTQLTGNATLATNQIDLGGILLLANDAQARSDRVASDVAIRSPGGRLALSGNATASVSQSAGTMTLAGGRTELLLLPVGGQPVNLNLAGIARPGRETLFARNVAVGDMPGTFTLNAAPAQIGGGTGATELPVVPWAVGNPINDFRIGNSLMTHEAATGRLRPLDVNSEYAATFDGATPQTNVRLTPTNAFANTSVELLVTNLPAGGADVNSLVIANQSTFINKRVEIRGAEGDVLRIRSGAILSAPVSGTNSTTFFVPIDFGSAEGIFHNGSGVSVSLAAPMSGTGGVTFGGGGSVGLSNAGNSTYTGQTTFLNGTVQFEADILPGAPSPFGADTSALVFNPGTLANIQFLANANVRVGRNLVVLGDAAGGTLIGTTTPLGTPANPLGLTINGDVDLQGTLGVTGPSGVNRLGVTINGTVSGPGRLAGAGSSIASATINGSNTYTGGTLLARAGFLAGNDRAFGTGPIFADHDVSTGFSRLGATGAARTLANELVLIRNFELIGDRNLTITGETDLAGGRRQIRVGVGPDFTLAGSVRDGGIIKIGDGTLVLSGDNTFTSGLQVGGFTAASAPVAGGTVVLASANAAGVGDVDVFVGTLATSAGFGTFNIAGHLVIGDLGTVRLDFGTANDLFVVGGDVQLGGTLDVAAAPGFGVGDYIFATYLGNASGLIAVTGLPDGFTADVSAAGGFVTLTVVPEPATAGLLAAGVLGLRRRR